MRGRKPKPNALKLAIGSCNARAEDSVPTPPVAAPPVPAMLGPVARAEWERVAGEMADMGTLASADLAVLACYAQAWARFVEAEGKLASEGAIVKAPSGYPIPSPWLAVANKAMEQLTKLAAEMGLSPTSRSRLHVGKRQDGGSDKRSRFFPKTLKLAE